MQSLNKAKIFFLIFTAIVIGLIYFLPNVLIPHFYNQENGTNYTWRDMGHYTFEEMFSYGTNIKDIIDGHFGGGDPFLWEYKNMPTGWDYYWLSLIIGVILKLLHLGGSLPLLFVVGDFIFPPISFLIIFFLFYKITKFFLFSILSSIVFLYFSSLFLFSKMLSADFYNNFSLLKISNVFTDIFFANSNFSRLFVPALTMFFLNLFLLLLYYVISENIIKKKCLIIAGISYGLLFYVYFYYWVFITVSLGFLLCFLFFFKREIFWRVLRIFIYGLIVSIPYWIGFFVLTGNPIYGELKQRIGLLEGKIFILPGGGYWAALGVFLLSGLVFVKKIRQNVLFFYVLSFLMSILVVRNLQLVFGFNPQPDHWGSRITVYFIIFAILISAFWMFYRVLENNKKVSALVLLTVILFLLAIASASQITKAQDFAFYRDAYFLDKGVTDSFEWINKNTKSDSVFLTDAEMTRTALAFYTHANVYLPHACISLASNGEIVQRYREVYALYRVPADMLQDFFEYNSKGYTFMQRSNLENDFSMFCITYQAKDGYAGGTPKKIVDEFMGKYKITKPNIEDLKYRADYLFYGPYEKSISDFDAGKYPELNQVYSNDSVQIYRIIR